MFKNLFTFFIIIVLGLRLSAQDFKTSALDKNFSASENSIIYALPRTYIKISIEVTKTTLIKGPYAEYAKKYLGLTNVPMQNSSDYAISSVSLNPVNEADPDNYYSVSFKNFPENLRVLLSGNNCGVILYPQPADYKSDIYHDNTGKIFDPRYVDETIKEKVDTLYKTIISDSSIIKIPVFKKQILAKTEEDLIKETANELIKTRKRRIKLARGEYEYHPDGETLKVMFAELQKQEEEYLTLFQGIKQVEKQTYTFMVLPDKNLSDIKVTSFDEKTGVNNSDSSSAISLKLISENQLTLNSNKTEKLPLSNTIFYRTPEYFNAVVLLNNQELAKYRLPLYQFGKIQNVMVRVK